MVALVVAGESVNTIEAGMSWRVLEVPYVDAWSTVPKAVPVDVSPLKTRKYEILELFRFCRTAMLAIITTVLVAEVGVMVADKAVST